MRVATGLTHINYYLTNNNKWGHLRQDCVIQTNIFGYEISFNQVTKNKTLLEFTLDKHGLITVKAGSEWDFGSGPAVNNPAMVRASLPHDVICNLTDYGLIPWEYREYGDRLLRELIKEFTPKKKWYNPFRYSYAWRWAGVRSYSKFIAYWKKEDFIA